MKIFIVMLNGLGVLFDIRRIPAKEGGLLLCKMIIIISN